jgi:hypothetical protein
MRGSITEQAEHPAMLTRAFSTRLARDPAERTRTRGHLLTDAVSGPWPIGFHERAIAPEALGHDAAYGKVAVLRGGAASSETASFQLDDSPSHAEIAACSNATAAAVAWHAATSGTGTPALDLELPGAHRARIVGEVRPAGVESSVRQTWQGVHVELAHDAEVDRRRVAVCTGSLNNYLVVRTRPGESTDAFSLDDALTLWQHFGMDRAPLLSRMIVVEGDRHLQVRCFTCGTRAHPSAAPTGLAVVALAARHLDWLPRLPATVRTPGGTVHTPRVEVASDGAADVHFPEVLVTIAGPGDPPTPGA